MKDKLGAQRCVRKDTLNIQWCELKSITPKAAVYTKHFVFTKEEESGSSWRFVKEPRRFLYRFFVPLSSRRRKGNPLLSSGRRETPSVCFADSSLREGAISS